MRGLILFSQGPIRERAQGKASRSPAPLASSSPPAPLPQGPWLSGPEDLGTLTLHGENHMLVGHPCGVAGRTCIAAGMDGEGLPDLQGACR